MKKQIRVINRDSRNEQIMNEDEFKNFTKYNNQINYAVTPIKSIEQQKESFLSIIVLACFSLAFILTATKMVMRWI